MLTVWHPVVYLRNNSGICQTVSAVTYKPPLDSWPSASCGRACVSADNVRTVHIHGHGKCQWRGLCIQHISCVPICCYTSGTDSHKLLTRKVAHIGIGSLPSARSWMRACLPLPVENSKCSQFLMILTLITVTMPCSSTKRHGSLTTRKLLFI
jgi:hypothetical protein